MSTQTASTETPVRAFAALLRAHASATRQLSAELHAEHGLTINDFEALYRLANAEGRQMKRVDLARQLLLTPSGVTRLLAGLERAGLVRKAACPTDLRVSYAVLTDEGAAKLDAASCDHMASVAVLFGERLSEDEVGTLTELLDKMAGADDDAPCGPA